MSADDEQAGFALPTFKPDEALAQIQRSLRDMQLAGRGNGFELRGKRVIELDIDGSSIAVRLARRLMQTPPWDSLRLQSSADQRKLIDELKKRLARWDQED